jgi:hypothetical protein
LNFLSWNSKTLLTFKIFALCNGLFLITRSRHSLSLLLPMNVIEWTLENYKLHVLLPFHAIVSISKPTWKRGCKPYKQSW